MQCVAQFNALAMAQQVRKLCTGFFVVISICVASLNLHAQEVKFYDVGHYPDGTWAELWGVNRAGTLVGMGDVASGYTHPIGVPLFGWWAGQWFDLGTLGGERADYVMCMDIADTGMIVGHTAIAGDEIIHGFVWTPQTKMVDLGTLADIGYSGYNFSLAYGTNKSGTLIVGWSSTGIDENALIGPAVQSYPVVWTPTVTWNSGRWKTTWQIHKLDIRGFDRLGYWAAMYPNDHGQIVGVAQRANGTLVGFLWNPVAGGGNWEIEKLPAAHGYNTVWPQNINNKGEIVGDVMIIDPATGNWNAELPAYWKPIDRSATNFSVTILPSLGGYLSGVGDGEGINDLGDIIGGSTDADGNYYATAWNTRNLKAAPRLLPSPSNSGGWSWANKLNNYGIVVGAYGADEWEHAAAWKLY